MYTPNRSLDIMSVWKRKPADIVSESIYQGTCTIRGDRNIVRLPVGGRFTPNSLRNQERLDLKNNARFVGNRFSAGIHSILKIANIVLLVVGWLFIGRQEEKTALYVEDCSRLQKRTSVEDSAVKSVYQNTIEGKGKYLSALIASLQYWLGIKDINQNFAHGYACQHGGQLPQEFDALYVRKLNGVNHSLHTSVWIDKKEMDYTRHAESANGLETEGDRFRGEYTQNQCECLNISECLNFKNIDAQYVNVSCLERESIEAQSIIATKQIECEDCFVLDAILVLVDLGITLDL